MAIFYTDLALRQSIGSNFPGEPGKQQITNLPTNTGQTNALFEGPPDIIATYTLVGTEAAGDTINIAKLEPGYIASPSGKVCSGVTAPGTTLTLAVGDNDLGDPSLLPLTNAAALQGYIPNQPIVTAPLWVSGTSYVPGNVVRDGAASSGTFVQYDVYTCVAATSGTTAPHSAATTVWQPNVQRYSTTIDVHAASANVAFAGGIQLYGGPASLLPYSVTPGQAALGLTANEIACQQYQIQNDCWLQARILTASTLTAGTVLTFRLGINTAAN